MRKWKTLENSQDYFVKTNTKTLLFVVEAPRDQDFGLEDYMTDPSTVVTSDLGLKDYKHL